MFCQGIPCQFYMLALAQAMLISASPDHADHQVIGWQNCNMSKVPSMLCGKLSVPLDYTEARSNKSLALDLYKIPAQKTPVQGSILLNFGGPGQTGKDVFTTQADLLQAYTGGYHDLILHNPRGTADTLPFSCHSEGLGAVLLPLDNAAIPTNVTHPVVEEVWAATKIEADACFIAENKTGNLIGTAFTARDLMSIVDALGEDGMLRYWGFSYGTVLGATVAAMFPQRIDKLVLDGVTNVHDYYHSFTSARYTTADDNFVHFCTACVAHPHRCRLAMGRTSAELQEAIYSLLDALEHNQTSDSLGKYGRITSELSNSLYHPSNWGQTARFIKAVISNRTSTQGLPVVTLKSDLQRSETLLGIKCGDTFARASSLAAVPSDLDLRGEQRKIFKDQATISSMMCAQWRFAAKERYDGNFTVQTKNPVLIIGNSFDAITPLVSAQNLSSGFEGSVLLQQDGYGHTSLAQPSLCTAKAIGAYFTNGTLPQPGTICDVDVKLFEGSQGFDKVLRKLVDGNDTDNNEESSDDEDDSDDSGIVFHHVPFLF